MENVSDFSHEALNSVCKRHAPTEHHANFLILPASKHASLYLSFPFTLFPFLFRLPPFILLPSSSRLIIYPHANPYRGHYIRMMMGNTDSLCKLINSPFLAYYARPSMFPLITGSDFCSHNVNAEPSEQSISSSCVLQLYALYNMEVCMLAITTQVTKCITRKPCGTTPFTEFPWFLFWLLPVKSWIARQ